MNKELNNNSLPNKFLSEILTEFQKNIKPYKVPNDEDEYYVLWQHFYTKNGEDYIINYNIEIAEKIEAIIELINDLIPLCKKCEFSKSKIDKFPTPDEEFENMIEGLDLDQQIQLRESWPNFGISDIVDDIDDNFLEDTDQNNELDE